MTCEVDLGAKKVVIYIDEEALPMGEGNKKISRENTVDSLVEAVIC